MPTTAVTGTKTLRTKRVQVSDDTRTDSEREADENVAAARAEIAAARVLPQPAPLADPNGNGTVQSVKADGSIVNYDAAEVGWEDRVFEGTSKAG